MGLAGLPCATCWRPVLKASAVVGSRPQLAAFTNEFGHSVQAHSRCALARGSPALLQETRVPFNRECNVVRSLKKKKKKKKKNPRFLPPLKKKKKKKKKKS